MCRNPVLKHFYKQISSGLERAHHNMVSKAGTPPQLNNSPGQQNTRPAAKFYSTSGNDNPPDQYNNTYDTARLLAKGGIDLNSTAAHVMANKYLGSHITSKEDNEGPSQQILPPASNMASQQDPASQSTLNMPGLPPDPMYFQNQQQNASQQNASQQYQQFPGVMPHFGQGQQQTGDGISSDGKMSFTIPEATFSTDYQQDLSQPLQHLQAAMGMPQMQPQAASEFQVPFPPFQGSGPQQGPPGVLPHLMSNTNSPVVFPGQQPQVTNFGKPESAITFAHLTLDSYSSASQNNTLFPGTNPNKVPPFQGAPPPPFQ